MHFGNATRTFYEVKCSASHFTKENVQHHILLCKMFSITKEQNVQHHKGAKCSAKSKKTKHSKKQRCFALRTFCFAKMHLMQKCICNILCYKMYASNAFLQNKMYASNTFLHSHHNLIKKNKL